MTTGRPSSSSYGRGRRRRPGALVLIAALVVAASTNACTDDPDPSPTTATEASCRPDEVPPPIDAEGLAETDTSGTTVTLVTHDSFAISDGIFDRFTEDTGITVELLSSGDAGSMVSQSILTAGTPVADVMFGIDTTFLCRGTKAGLFLPFAPAALADVDDALEQAVAHLATPIDVGDVCLNYAKASYDEETAPTGLDDLTDPAFRNQFVTENPETSSPGLAFLLATIASYGEDGWEQYWTDLRANGLEVDSGWEEAYNGSFGAGSGERSVVTSYATSPVADVLYADPPRTEPAIGVVAAACFRQVEFAGVLRGTEHPEAAAKLVAFMLSPEFQADIPLNMFVEAANDRTEIPAEFEANRVPIDAPLTLSPAEIEAGRDRWTERWTQIVLR